MDRHPPAPSRRLLRDRHVAMITAGGIIGAGLLVGSSASIAAVGPAAVVSYALAGAALLLIMQIVRDMTVADAGPGPFTELVRRGLGEGAGFVSGWLYWYFWAVVVPVEALAGAEILHAVLPLPVWQIGLVLLTVMTAVNLTSARSYGESEFWLSSLKVGGVLAFIAVAAAYASGLTSPSGPTWSNLYVHGGFAPAGAAAVLAGIPGAVFSVTGAEIATLAAADSADPRRAASRMTRSLGLRILTFHLGSLALIVAIVPWTAIRPGVSPFAAALEAMHVPAAAAVMNLLVLIAVISCLNSALYITSRVLKTLAIKGDAPSRFGEVNAGGAPVWAVLASSLPGYLALLASILSPREVFSFLVNASGAAMIFVYLFLCAAQLRVSARSGRMWRGLQAWAACAAVAIFGAALSGMMATPALASQLQFSLLTFGAILAAYALRRAGALRLCKTGLRRIAWVRPALSGRRETVLPAQGD